MAANIIVEVLKQLQQDFTAQKDCMRDINEKLSDLNNKVDQQQVTLDRLEQQVTKNNKLLFGNDETDINIKELSVMLYKPECNDNNKQAVVGNDAANQFQKTSKAKNTHRNSDKVKKCVDEEPVELKDEYEEVESRVQKQETVQISPSYFNIEQINQLHVDLKQIMAEINEIKESIKGTPATRITSVDETIGEISKGDNIHVPTCFSSEHINRMDGELKQIMSEMIEMKELIKDTIATKRNPVEETASPVCKQETVQISLNYLSRDQIRRLNDELKQMTEKYQSTNIFPVVELIQRPDLNSWVITSLCKGAYFSPKPGTNCARNVFKLGIKGLKRCEVQDLVAEYPHLSPRDIIEEILRSNNKWEDVTLNYEVNNLYYM